MTTCIWRYLSSAVLLVALVPNQPALAQTASWIPVGPDGGDGRSFAADPNNDKHLYLGTTNSWIYQSQDGGASWQRLAKLAKTDDLLLDNIVENIPSAVHVKSVRDGYRIQLWNKAAEATYGLPREAAIGSWWWRPCLRPICRQSTSRCRMRRCCTSRALCR